MKLIVGLGNIGSQYGKTRHNIGFMIVDQLAKNLGATWKTESKLKAAVATTEFNGKKLLLAKPATMMNLSGEAIQRIMQHYKITPGNVWVVFDDVDVPFGRLRVRYGGGSGGHQGINSTIQHVGNQFIRFRTGISLNDRATEPSEVYVLKPFNHEEQAQLPAVISVAATVIEQQLTAGAPAESTFNLI